jgi:methylated-DNA-[protein]-cysteine S-methyltransferase
MVPFLRKEIVKGRIFNWISVGTTSNIPNTMPGQFSHNCYDLLKKVPAGRVTTYRELAHALGTKAYRAVGQAMNKNPYAPKVPCHRVISSDGSLGGFAGGKAKKIALLKKEGVVVNNGRVVDWKTKLYRF